MQQAAFSFSSLLLPAVEANESSEKHWRMEESRSMFQAVQTEAKLKKRGSKCLHLRHWHVLGVLHHLQRPSSANIKKFPTHTHMSHMSRLYTRGVLLLSSPRLVHRIEWHFRFGARCFTPWSLLPGMVSKDSQVHLDSSTPWPSLEHHAMLNIWQPKAGTHLSLKRLLPVYQTTIKEHVRTKWAQWYSILV